MEHRSQTLLYRSSCSSTALPSTKKEQKSTGIPRTARHLLLSMLACPCLQKKQKEAMICSMGMGSAYHMTELSAAVDNTDHNPSATTAQTSFHGPSLSIFQNPSPENAGEERAVLKLNSDMKMKTAPELPEAYTNVRPAYITKNPNPPPVVCHSFPAPHSIQSHLKDEYCWLEEMADAVCITWSSHHATQKRSKPFDVSISALMPLMRDCEVLQEMGNPFQEESADLLVQTQLLPKWLVHITSGAKISSSHS